MKRHDRGGSDDDDNGPRSLPLLTDWCRAKTCLRRIANWPRCCVALIHLPDGCWKGESLFMVDEPSCHYWLSDCVHISALTVGGSELWRSCLTFMPVNSRGGGGVSVGLRVL